LSVRTNNITLQAAVDAPPVMSQLYLHDGWERFVVISCRQKGHGPGSACMKYLFIPVVQHSNWCCWALDTAVARKYGCPVTGRWVTTIWGVTIWRWMSRSGDKVLLTLIALPAMLNGLEMTACREAKETIGLDVHVGCDDGPCRVDICRVTVPHST